MRNEVESELDEEQGAFRPHRQTQDLIYTIRTIGEKFLDKNKSIYMAFLDLKSAFDTASRKEIWKTLKKMGVTNKLIRAIKSIYHSTIGMVRIDGLVSEEFEMENGVTQGDCLSPLLFIILLDEGGKLEYETNLLSSAGLC